MSFHLGKAMASQDVESGALPKIPRRAFWSIVAWRSGCRTGNPHFDLSSGSGQNPQMCFFSCRCTVTQFQYVEGRPDHKALV
jgi:hypothetical protein